MGLIPDFYLFLELTRSSGIARRYFVVNGFDGALTMLGIVSGFLVSGSEDLRVALGACFGAAIALGISGFSSAYVSEVAERKKWLKELEAAMLTGMQSSDHARAARIVPLFIAAINGLAPLLIAMIIMLPLLLARFGVFSMPSPYLMTVLVAFSMIFALGAYLGRVSQHFWLLSGLKTLAIGIATAGVVMLLGQLL